MENPKISIIVPIYNTEKYLFKCIESVHNQTYKNLEIILINDGSTDNSLGICQEFADKDKRIIVIDKENEGVSSARNRGLDFASGDYIGFVDSDDYIAPDMYQQLLTACLENDADIAECGRYIVDTNYNIVSWIPLKSSVLNGNYECSKAFFKEENRTNSNCNKLYKKKIFNTIRFPSYKYAEDFWVNAKAFYGCKRKVTIDGCYYYYLKHEKSAWHSPFKKEKLDAINCVKDIYEFYKDKLPDLCPYVALYTASMVIGFHKELKVAHSFEIQKKFSDILITEFKSHYKLVNNGITKDAGFTNNQRIALFLFNISPELYYSILYLYHKIKEFSKMQ